MSQFQTWRIDVVLPAKLRTTDGPELLVQRYDGFLANETFVKGSQQLSFEFWNEGQAQGAEKALKQYFKETLPKDSEYFVYAFTLEGEEVNTDDD